MKRVNLEVLRMAREAGMQDCTCNGTLGCLERFANLVRADEREACASECDEWIKNGSALAEDIAAAIRARSNT